MSLMDRFHARQYKSYEARRLYCACCETIKQIEKERDALNKARLVEALGKMIDLLERME